MKWWAISGAKPIDALLTFQIFSLFPRPSASVWRVDQGAIGLFASFFPPAVKRRSGKERKKERGVTPEVPQRCQIGQAVAAGRRRAQSRSTSTRRWEVVCPKRILPVGQTRSLSRFGSRNQRSTERPSGVCGVKRDWCALSAPLDSAPAPLANSRATARLRCTNAHQKSWTSLPVARRCCRGFVFLVTRLHQRRTEPPRYDG